MNPDFLFSLVVAYFGLVEITVSLLKLDLNNCFMLPEKCKNIGGLYILLTGSQQVVLKELVTTDFV